MILKILHITETFPFLCPETMECPDRSTVSYYSLVHANNGLVTRLTSFTLGLYGMIRAVEIG